MRRLTGRIAAVAIAGFIAVNAAAQRQSGQESQERGRLDPYVADYSIENEYHLQLGTSGRHPNGKFWNIPDRWVDKDDYLNARQASSWSAELSTLTDLCGTAGGRLNKLGFQRLNASYVLKLRKNGPVTSRRTMIRGTTSYEGVEDQEPGRFLCMIEDGQVKLWLFEPT